MTVIVPLADADADWVAVADEDPEDVAVELAVVVDEPDRVPVPLVLREAVDVPVCVRVKLAVELGV